MATFLLKKRERETEAAGLPRDTAEKDVDFLTTTQMYRSYQGEPHTYKNAEHYFMK